MKMEKEISIQAVAERERPIQALARQRGAVIFLTLPIFSPHRRGRRTRPLQALPTRGTAAGAVAASGAGLGRTRTPTTAENFPALQRRCRPVGFHPAAGRGRSRRRLHRQKNWPPLCPIRQGRPATARRGLPVAPTGPVSSASTFSAGGACCEPTAPAKPLAAMMLAHGGGGRGGPGGSASLARSPARQDPGGAGPPPAHPRDLSRPSPQPTRSTWGARGSCEGETAADSATRGRGRNAPIGFRRPGFGGRVRDHRKKVREPRMEANCEGRGSHYARPPAGGGRVRRLKQEK